MKIHIITDTHFGHKDLATKLKVRPDDFQERIINAWRLVVAEDDLVIHLGDVMVGKPTDWLSGIPDLPGRKVLIKGNHDKKSAQWYMNNGFEFYCETFSWQMFGYQLLFSHEPVFSGNFDLNIHGHLHGAAHRDYPKSERHLLLSLEDSGYRPHLLKTILQSWEKDRNKNSITKEARMFDSLQSIRKNPSLYLPQIGAGTHPDDAIYIMFKEIVENAMDEFIVGRTQQIDICLSEEKGVTVRDYGHGIIPRRLIDCFTQINVGATYSTEVYIFSLGLSGMGGKIVNALSERFKVTTFRKRQFYSATFQKGLLVTQDQGETDERDGTWVEFLPDKEIFPDFSFNVEFLEKRLRHYSFLRPGLTLRMGTNIYQSRNGLLDLFHYEFAKDELYPPIYYRDETLEFVFAHTKKSPEHFLSFVNGSQTKKDGTHLSVFMKGILHGINRYSGKTFKDTAVITGMCGAISIKILEPQFDDNKRQDKLCSKNVSHYFAEKIQNGVHSALKTSPDTARRLLKVIEES